MQEALQHIIPLGEYVDISALLPSVEHTFPSKDSLKWFVRRHREELAAAGALICITGRLRFHPTLFQRTAVEIGRSSVCAKAETPRR